MKMRWIMIAALVAVALAGLLLAPTAWAQSATATLTANANLRSGPGTSFAKVGSAALGSTVTLAGCTAAGDWCKLTDGTWVFAELLDGVPAGLPEVEDVTATTPAPTRAAGGLLPTATPSRGAAATTAVSTPAAPTSSGPVATGNANLRSGPGTGFERVGSVAAGQALEIVGKTAAGDWYQLDDGAWIAAFLVSGAVGEVAVVEAPAASSTAAAPPAAADPTSPAASSERSLFVEFINPVYNCHNRIFEFEGTPGITEQLYVPRSFQVDMYITNNGTIPVEPPWRPKRWIITDGQTEMVNDLMWEWTHRDFGHGSF